MTKPLNKIEKLIAELCPEGVEFKELGEVCIIRTGQAVNKIDIPQNPGEFPVITYIPEFFALHCPQSRENA
jgi:type I restriction enzyme S subunit